MLLLKTKSVVMDVIHNMDVIDQLSAALKSQGQIGADDWVWQKQLRFQMEPNESGSRICRARMCDALLQRTGRAGGGLADCSPNPFVMRAGGV